MKYAMDRRDFKRLYGVPFEQEYPKCSRDVIMELRQRGLNATKSRLDYLLLKHEIPEPLRVGVAGNWKWMPKDVDAAAEIFDNGGLYTPEAGCWAVLHVRFAQAIQALRDAQASWPASNRDLFVVTVHPGRDVCDASDESKGDYKKYPYNLVVFELDEAYQKCGREQQRKARRVKSKGA